MPHGIPAKGSMYTIFEVSGSDSFEGVVIGVWSQKLPKTRATCIEPPEFRNLILFGI